MAARRSSDIPASSHGYDKKREDISCNESLSILADEYQSIS